MSANNPDTERVVLVVDDEALLRMLAVDILEDAGYVVVVAESAAEAISVLEGRNDVRLLFTDIQMPGRFDGMDLAWQVHGRWPAILLIITSGRLRPLQDDMPLAGRFVGKPYDSNALMIQVNDLFRTQGFPIE